MVDFIRWVNILCYLEKIAKRIVTEYWHTNNLFGKNRYDILNFVKQQHMYQVIQGKELGKNKFHNLSRLLVHVSADG